MSTSRSPARIAWTVAAVSVILAPVTGVLGMSRGGSVHGVSPFVASQLEFLIGMPMFALVGAVIAARRPANLVWAVLSGVALGGVLQLFAVEWAIYAQLRNPGLPGGAVAAWVGNWMYPASAPLPGVLLLVFPDGRPLSKRWGWILRLAPVAAVLGAVATAFFPGWSENDPQGALTPISNPLGIRSLEGISEPLLNVSFAFVMVIFVAGVASLVVRYRRSRDDVRHQIKWFTATAALLPVTVVLYDLSIGAYGGKVPLLTSLLVAVGLAAVVGTPLAIGVAILKYRLYDIDVVISRTLVYGALAAFITAVYVGIVVGIGHLVGSGGQPNLVLSIVATAIVSVAFQPVRERLQRIANRLVYGKRATPYEVLSQFSEHVAETYASDEALPRMARVLAEGTGADRAEVWVRSGGVLRPAAVWPDLSSNGAEAAITDAPIPLTGETLPALPGDSAVAVMHQGELLGALTVTKRAGESLTPIEQKLLDDLAHQAGLVLKNVGLTAELLARLDDLRASRQRLVAAQDEERRRLERNLHDGAQQNLVALKVKLGLAEMLAEKDPQKAKTLLAELKGDTDETLDTLRDLARGIYPPLLADKGLVAALESQARKATLPVSVEAADVARYSQEVEAAVYFCVLEALQNVQKYAQASRAAVRLAANDDTLSFEVEDDGTGFDSATVSKSSGLQNMEDRLDALGGSIEVRSSSGNGTTISGKLPMIATKATAPSTAAL